MDGFEKIGYTLLAVAVLAWLAGALVIKVLRERLENKEPRRWVRDVVAPDRDPGHVDN